MRKDLENDEFGQWMYVFYIICSDKLNLKAEWRIVMNELDYGRIGKRIRQVRKAKGWSQDELARKCGIRMSFLGHIERGTRI